MTDHLPMAELAARWSELLIADLEPEVQLPAAARAAGSLLRPPATEVDVVAAEERLGRRLPGSYRQFLLVSNGAYGDESGASFVYDDEPEEPPAESDVPAVGFLPVQDVRWLRDIQPWMADAMAESDEDEPGRPVQTDGEEPWPWGPMADGLLIATDKGPGTTVLIPFEGLVEWQMWNVTKETSWAFRSFRSFLEREVLLREPVTEIDEVRRLIDAARAGDHVATMRLSRITTPEAVPLLAPYADDPRLGVQPALALARIGTPEALAMVERLEPRTAHLALRAVGSDRANEVLVRAGDFATLSTTGDLRAFDLAARYIESAVADPRLREDSRFGTAVYVLGGAGDPAYGEVLLPLLRLPHEEVSAAYALARLGRPEGERHLASVSASPDHSDADRARGLIDLLQRHPPRPSPFRPRQT